MAAAVGDPLPAGTGLGPHAGGGADPFGTAADFGGLEFHEDELNAFFSGLEPAPMDPLSHILSSHPIAGPGAAQSRVRRVQSCTPLESTPAAASPLPPPRPSRKRQSPSPAMPEGKAAPRGGGVRRTSSLPPIAAMPQAASLSDWGALPMWARDLEGEGSKPRLSEAGLPAFAVPIPPPSHAAPTSAFAGVSREPWSTRWSVHVPPLAAAPRESAAASPPLLYVGSFDGEERAARAHDLAVLKLHGGGADGPPLNFQASSFCAEGLHDLESMPAGQFVDALTASSFEQTERRYSKYRGVFKGGESGGWEARLEAPEEKAGAEAPPPFGQQFS